MKTKTLVAFLLLAGCGVARHEGATAEANDPGRCFSCVSTCTRVKPSLVRDFGFSELEIDCDQGTLKGVESCRQCATLFEAHWGVELTGCR